MPELFLVEKKQPPLPDASQREQALDIRASWIVEAPAGSGKTGLLIQRYLKLLADESVESPEQVLAITFTKKATAEMRERVLSQLQSAAIDDDPVNAFDRETRPIARTVLDRDRAMHWQLLEQPARLNIRTIDSVSSDIASSLPLLSGSGGRRSTVEDAQPLYLTAARRTLMQLGGQDTELDRALRTVLLHRDGDLLNCEKLLADMLEHREQWGEFVPVGSQPLDDAWLDINVLPRLERALEQAICAALTQLANTIPADILSQLSAAGAEMAHIGGYKSAISPIAICAGKHASPQAISEDLAHWRALMHLLITPSTRSWRKVFSANIVKFDLSKSDQAQLKSLVEQLHHRDDLLRAICTLGILPPAKYPQEQWVVAKALFRILNHALAELQLVFAERSECDFTELALAARTVLRHDDGARDLESASSIHLQHLLVDEMQDTSSSQYELIQMLTAGWDGHSQTALLVGDPKQSIYLFRQARVERFVRTMRTRRLGNLPLGVLRLTANFRSQATLVAEFNEDFAMIFPSAIDAEHLEEVLFVEASAIRPSGQMNAGRIWHAKPLASDDAKSKKLQRKSDAEAIRAIVEQWQSKPRPPERTLRGGNPEPWKIAVLVRSRSHLSEIIAEFKGTGAAKPIPYRAVDIEPLGSRPEVLDLFALTRALLHPADRIAWLAVLRAPWCGLSLAELHTITGADDPAFAQSTVMQLLAERGHLLDEHACQRLARIWPTLDAAVAATGRLPLPQTLERTWRSLGGDAYLSEQELTNARRYLQLLDELEGQSSTFDLAALKRKMTRLYAAPIIQPGAVELLTIYKAKGLEWDVVIVPALERIAARDRNPLLTWVEVDTAPDIATTSAHDAVENGAAHIVLAPIAGKGNASTELNTWIRSIRVAREAAERKRLFYVACTRAREELHLFAAPALSVKGVIMPAQDSLLKSAWLAAEPYVAGAIEVQGPQRSFTEDEQPFAIAASAPEASEQLLGALSIAAFRSGWESDSVTQLGSQSTILQRLPITFDPRARFNTSPPLQTGQRDDVPASPHFERPEGSVAARAFGTAVHTFLEVATKQLATGVTSAGILAALSSWTPRIVRILRSEGLQPAMVERLAQGVLRSLQLTLNDPHGLWLLSPHKEATTEYALTTWSHQRHAIRIDRIFRAGPEPLEHGGSECLWIIDYKTTTHGSEGLDAFLASERAKHAPQLEAYAEALQQAKGEPSVRLALYYPMLSKLIWWQL